MQLFAGRGTRQVNVGFVGLDAIVGKRVSSQFVIFVWKEVAGGGYRDRSPSLQMRDLGLFSYLYV